MPLLDQDSNSLVLFHSWFVAFLCGCDEIRRCSGNKCPRTSPLLCSYLTEYFSVAVVICWLTMSTSRGASPQSHSWMELVDGAGRTSSVQNLFIRCPPRVDPRHCYVDVGPACLSLRRFTARPIDRQQFANGLSRFVTALWFRFSRDLNHDVQIAKRSQLNTNALSNFVDRATRCFV